MRNEESDRGAPNGLDALIDDAARRLVAGEPSSALRTGVRNRIGGRRRIGMLVPILAGAVALLVVSVIVGRALSGVSDGSGTARSANGRPAIERTVPAIASQRPVAPPTQPERSRPRQLSRRHAAVTPPPVEEESLIPPITIAPLSTEPIEMERIAVDESSGVALIEIAPLQIEPLPGQ